MFKNGSLGLSQDSRPRKMTCFCRGGDMYLFFQPKDDGIQASVTIRWRLRWFHLVSQLGFGFLSASGLPVQKVSGEDEDGFPPRACARHATLRFVPRMQKFLPRRPTNTAIHLFAPTSQFETPQLLRNRAAGL